jgi:hypothetical protein
VRAPELLPVAEREPSLIIGRIGRRRSFDYRRRLASSASALAADDVSLASFSGHRRHYWSGRDALSACSGATFDHSGRAVHRHHFAVPQEGRCIAGADDSGQTVLTRDP